MTDDDPVDLEREAAALVDIFNEAAPDHSPGLEWLAMCLDTATDEHQFVLEATGYIDPAGLAALRDHGRAIRYIEAYELEDAPGVQIQTPVRGRLPEEATGRTCPECGRPAATVVDVQAVGGDGYGPVDGVVHEERLGEGYGGGWRLYCHASGYEEADSA